MESDTEEPIAEVKSASQSPTFDRDVEIHIDETVGSASISPCGRDVVVASRAGLHIIDLDAPYRPPRHLAHYSPWEVADVQWSPFAARDYWVVSTSNQKALVWNLEAKTASSAIELTLHAHSRAITDINFSAHDPDLLATCAVDSYVHCWDLRQQPAKMPVMTFADWNAGATQVKWNRQDQNILASCHDRFLHIWDKRKGAHPLKTIEAHGTKIYGLDWSRTESTSLLTCSLDKTIKFWDHSKGGDRPERIIRTDYPVWRARHTPFGSGVLAMPQRGDFNLHLYNQRCGIDTPVNGSVRPSYSFKGHNDQVKEFLWRSRGDIDADSIDHREFQLISWGIDKYLHLHRIESRHLHIVEHEKGKAAKKNLNITRAGAVYRTFRNVESAKTGQQSSDEAEAPQGLGSLVNAAGMSKTSMVFGAFGSDRGFAFAASNMYGAKSSRPTSNPIKWMEGVKMGRKRAQTMDPFSSHPSVSRTSVGDVSPRDNHEKLSDEITSVAKRFRKVKFEKAEVHDRVVVVTLHGPWGAKDEPAFIRMTFNFPAEYPTFAAPECHLERGTSAIDQSVFQKLTSEVRQITAYFQQRGTGCLEAVITYLLGERDLHDSILAAESALDEDSFMLHTGDSSSDEDEIGVAATGLDNSASDGLGLTAQANVPLPKACGAYFANDGRLICFFPPKPDPISLFNLKSLHDADRAGKYLPRSIKSNHLFDQSPTAREQDLLWNRDDDDSEGSLTSDSDTLSTSSSGSSDFETSLSRLPARFQPWRAAAFGHSKTSSRSHTSGGQAKPFGSKASKSIISIHDLSDLLPAKRQLAENYEVFGNGPATCSHNASVARLHKLEDIALIWELCSIILFHGIPLELFPHGTRDDLLVVAKRNVVRVKSKSSGLGLQFDDPPAVATPAFKARVKWGQHPLAQGWIIRQFFDYFERLADIQMLAMLACIFCEPAGGLQKLDKAASSGGNSTTLLSQRAPAFSLDYFASLEVARSTIHNVYKSSAILSTPLGTSDATHSDYFSRVPNFGSTSSKLGSFTREIAPSQPATPYSTGSTPPPLSKYTTHNNSLVASLSTSPDVVFQKSRRSTSHLSSALASLSRPFSLTASSSPDDRARLESDGVSSMPSGITWGLTTIISGGSAPSPEKRRRPSRRRSSALTFDDSTYNSSDDERLEIISSEHTFNPHKGIPVARTQPHVRVKLQNQRMFDEEAHSDVPLLDPAMSQMMAAYREQYAEQLAIWGLFTARAEILKFNGMSGSNERAEQDSAPSINLELPVLPRRGQLARQSLLGIATGLENNSRPNTLRKTSSTATITQAQRPPLRENSLTPASATRLNPNAKVFTPSTPTPTSDGVFDLEVRRVEGNLTMFDMPLVAVTSLDNPLCAVCWESIRGLYSYKQFSDGLDMRPVHVDCIS